MRPWHPPFFVFLLGNLLLVPAVSAQPAASPLAAISRLPEQKSSAVCPDSQLILTFNRPPALGATGQIRIYDTADDRLVDTLDLGVPVNQQNYSIGGVAGFHLYPVLISGNTAIIFPHHQALAYNKSYSVQIDPGVLKSESGDFPGFGSAQAWTFSTKTAPPAADAPRLVVAADGTGDFATVQGAIDFLPDNNQRPVTLFIRNGVYNEIVYFTRKSNLTFLGEDRRLTVIGYANNAVLNPSRRGVFMAERATGLALVNFSIKDVTPKGGMQAETVIFKTASQVLLSHINLSSFQDTLQISCPAYIADSYIEGDVDFLWGSGPCYFVNCEIKGITSRGYYTQIRNTAAGHGYVFVSCLLDSSPGVTGMYLSRIDPNVYPYSECVYLDCKLGTQFNPVGWLLNNATAAPNVHFWEYNSTNISDGQPADVSQRAPFSKQLTMENDAQTIANYRNPEFVLGTVPPLAPIILTTPGAQSAARGATATFRVEAAAVPAPAYQWQVDGRALADGPGVSGATTATLTLATAQPAQAGNYTVKITNAAGSATTAPATLSVK